MNMSARVTSLIFLVSLFFFTIMQQVYAAGCNKDTEMETDIGCIPNSAPGFVSKFYGYGLGLIGGVSVLFIIIGGYFILTSSGDPIRLSVGKSYIVYAIIGLLLAIFGYIFISVVVGDILRVPGFSS